MLSLFYFRISQKTWNRFQCVVLVSTVILRVRTTVLCFYESFLILYPVFPFFFFSFLHASVLSLMFTKDFVSCVRSYTHAHVYTHNPPLTLTTTSHPPSILDSYSQSLIPSPFLFSLSTLCQALSVFGVQSVYK